MASLASLATEVLTKLNTVDGGRWTATQATAALQSACRDIYVTPLLPNAYFLGVAKKVDSTEERTTIGDDGTIPIPKDMLRFVMATAGMIQIVDFLKMEEHPDNWSVAQASSIARPRIVQIGPVAKVLPAKSLKGLAIEFYYVPEDVSGGEVPAPLREAVVYRAASILAENGREFVTAKFLADKSMELLERLAKSL